MKSVCVLMSTYNGEKYIKEQLESILKQKNVSMKIIVRDDGSKDNTINILKEYEEQGKINFYKGENLKPAFSFMDLLYNAPEMDFYAFADQDDVWLEEKLFAAIKKMEKNEHKETVYFSNVELVDENLNIIMVNNNRVRNNLGEAFAHSPAIGCTMVINNKMRKKIIEKNIDGLQIGLHDSWIYRVALSIGANIVYDENYYIKYRQHQNNVVGLSKKKSFTNKIRDIFRKRNKFKSYVAKNILELYSNDILEKNIKILKKLSKMTSSNNFIDKLKIILDKRYFSSSIKSNLEFFYDIIMGRG